MIPDIHSTCLEYHASTPEAARLLRIYRDLAEHDGFASCESMLAMIGPAALSDIEVLTRLPEGEWRYCLFGAAIHAVRGADMTGRDLSALPQPIADAYRIVLDRVTRERRPLLAASRPFDAAQPSFWQRLVFPCRDGAGAVCALSLVKPRGKREDLLAAVFEASQDGMIAVRAIRGENGELVDGRIVSANRKALEYTRYNAEDMIDGRFKRLFQNATARRIWRRCKRVIAEGRPERFEINISHRHRDTWLRVTVVPLGDGFVISLTDFTDLKYALLEAECSREELAAEVERRRALEQELRQLSLTDDLTGVANRRAFVRALRQEIAKARRYRTTFSVVAVDIDHFKAINDRYGHAGGDEVLMSIAAAFTDGVRREVDIVARVGGEEFMLLLPDTPLAGAVDLAERLRERLAARPIAIAGECVPVTASFGVREFDRKSDPERLTTEVDNALYGAKRRGRNCVVASLPW